MKKAEKQSRVMLLLGVLTVTATLVASWHDGSALAYSGSRYTLAGTGPNLVSQFMMTPPTIDGIISPGEWGLPQVVSFQVLEQDKSVLGDLYFRNSNTELYVALALPNSSAGSLYVTFDGAWANDHDHVATADAEDAVSLEDGVGVADRYWNGSSWAKDGSQDALGRIGTASGKYVYEIKKPLNSGDVKDLAVIPGASVGFRITVSPDYIYPPDTSSSSTEREWKKWADLRLAAPLTVAPTLSGPGDGAQLLELGTTLSWTNPSGVTQYQIQVTPVNGDGPAINLIRDAAASYTVMPPNLGSADANYVMLPGMTYTWRVRATNLATSASENDLAWGPWSPLRSFRTAVRDSSGITPISPSEGSRLPAGPQVLQWDNGDKDVFYYEVQVSPDPKFGEGGPIASVWHNLVHGGVTTPLNSWQTPALQAGVPYFWRVRPRVQGDGTPVAWSQSWSFRAQ